MLTLNTCPAPAFPCETIPSACFAHSSPPWSALSLWHRFISVTNFQSSLTQRVENKRVLFYLESRPFVPEFRRIVCYLWRPCQFTACLFFLSFFYRFTTQVALLVCFIWNLSLTINQCNPTEKKQQKTDKQTIKQTNKHKHIHTYYSFSNIHTCFFK